MLKVNHQILIKKQVNVFLKKVNFKSNNFSFLNPLFTFNLDPIHNVLRLLKGKKTLRFVPFNFLNLIPPSNSIFSTTSSAALQTTDFSNSFSELNFEPESRLSYFCFDEQLVIDKRRVCIPDVGKLSDCSESLQIIPDLTVHCSSLSLVSDTSFIVPAFFKPCLNSTVTMKRYGVKRKNTRSRIMRSKLLKK